VRTTIRLPDDLLFAVKRLAAERGTTLTALIESSLRKTVAGPSAPVRKPPVRLTTCGGQGLQPGVDLDDSAALRDRMEEAAALPRQR